MYMIYVIILLTSIRSGTGDVSKEIIHFQNKVFKEIIESFLLPLLLVILVLGTIIGGCFPNRSGGSWSNGCITNSPKGKLNKKIITSVTKETLLLTSMVFMILVGATAFSLVFRGLQGDQLFKIISKSNLGPKGFFNFGHDNGFYRRVFIDFIESYSYLFR